MTEVERRHIEALAAISDEGTITAAAGKLHVSQPTLSRTLSRLETIVGVRLVDRSTHHLALTAAGQRFLPHARTALASIETAVTSARGPVGAIRLGYAWATNDHVASLVKHWERTNPDLAITPVYDEQPLTALTNGAIDLAITRTGPVADTQTVTLATENRYAALPAKHRLSRCNRVTLADLVTETIALTKTGTTSLDLWPPDQQPADTVTAVSVEEWLVHIATGHAVGVTVESIVQSRPHPDITYRPIEDTESVEIRLVSRWPSHHPLVNDLVAAAPIRRPGQGSA